MSVLPNPRHESFAQHLAKGKTADEAYGQAGYKANRGNAATLKANQSILDRVAELRERGAKKVEVTLESLAAELDEARGIALAEKQSSAAVQATMGKAKLFGLIIDKKQHSGAIGSYDLTKVTDDDLDRLEAILGPLADAGGDQGGAET